LTFLENGIKIPIKQTKGSAIPFQSAAPAKETLQPADLASSRESRVLEPNSIACGKRRSGRWSAPCLPALDGNDWEDNK
jgi:hypothetical protein